MGAANNLSDITGREKEEKTVSNSSPITSFRPRDSTLEMPFFESWKCLKLIFQKAVCFDHHYLFLKKCVCHIASTQGMFVNRMDKYYQVILYLIEHVS